MEEPVGAVLRGNSCRARRGGHPELPSCWSGLRQRPAPSPPQGPVCAAALPR